MFNKEVSINTGKPNSDPNNKTSKDMSGLIDIIAKLVQERLAKGSEEILRSQRNEFRGNAGMTVNAKTKIEGQIVGGK